MKILIIPLVIGVLFKFIETNAFDISQCNPIGIIQPFSISINAGECKCKAYVTGSRCDQCILETFYLSNNNELGCKRCFCMGLTTNCSSSSWYRNEINAFSENSLPKFSLIMPYENGKPLIIEGFHVNEDESRISYSRFSEDVKTDAIYWQLPAVFLGNKLASYGGKLKYTINYETSSQKLNSPQVIDVAIINSNINLMMHHSFGLIPQPNLPRTLTVVLSEEYWTIRSFGVLRKHFLMILSNITAIRVRATYTTQTDKISISHVSLDTATKVNTGKKRALEVEECSCPTGYVGLSCEECATGYSKGLGGLYLGICELNNSNGLDNYEYGESETAEYCNCEAAGSKDNTCVEGKCQCKANVYGQSCNNCRPSTFGLSVSNVNGCNECFCSGVTTECRASSLCIQSIVPNFYNRDHWFRLVDKREELPVTGDIEIDSSHEIEYHYDENDGKELMLSLSSIFTGNQVKSYGGNFKFSAKYKLSTVTNIKIRQEVMLKGNSLTLIWRSNDNDDIIPSTFKNYRVPLRESEWQKKTNDFLAVNATRADLMIALSNVEAIFVLVPYFLKPRSISIENVSLDTAAECPGEGMSPTIATQVEECTCPTGYTGTSCESCSRGYYRDIDDLSESILGRCKLCPCNNNADSCEFHGNSQVKCHCAAGYTGDYCQETEPVVVVPTQAFPSSLDTNDKEGWTKPDGILISPHAPLSEEAWRKIIPQSSTDSVYIYQAGNGEASSRTPAITEPPPSKKFPVLTLNPSSYASASRGGSITLHCSANDRHLEVQWHRTDGRQFTHNVVQLPDGVLQINDLKDDDVGNYACSTRNEYGSVSKIISILMNSIPVVEIILNPDKKNFKLGEHVTLICAAHGHPHALVSWHMTSLTTGKSRLLEQQNLMSNIHEIRSMSKNDEGIYNCSATNRVGFSYKQIEILIETIPSKTTSTPKLRTITPVFRPKLPILRVNPGTYASALLGGSITLNCIEEDLNLEVHWAREDGRSFTQNVQSNDGVLQITNISDDDAGTYLCSVTNEVGSVSKSVFIEIDSIPVAEITLNPDKKNFKLGEHVTLTCKAQGYPQPFIDWRMIKSKTRESKSLGQQTSVSNIYEIQYMSSNDEGVYICRASNSVGSDEKHIELLVVSEEPNPTTTPKPLPILPKNVKRELKVSKRYLKLPIGKTAEIDCYIVGPDDPQIKLKWEKRGHSLPKNTIMDNGHLVISQVTKENAGLYTCRARDRDGTQLYMAKSVLKVISLPKILEINPKNDTFNVGATLSILCRAEGDEPITIKWSRDGLPLLHNQEYNDYGALTFHEISSKDVGTYVCNATNEVGSVVGFSEVKLEGSKVRIIALSN